MSMEISNAYSSYVGNSAYATRSTNQKQATESRETDKTSTETQVATRKTAADELSYLSEKYSNFTFVAVNYKQGMQYGSMATTNIAISPEFLKKMANDSKLEKEYESYFDGMRKLDEENIRTHEARGRRMVAQGWAIDKNGGISRWGVSEPTNKRHYGQEMTDYANKIRKQKAEKAKEQGKLEEKRKAKREQEERLAEMRAERKTESKNLQSYEFKVVGSDVRDLTEKMIAAMKNPNSAAVSATAGLDLKI